MSQTRQPPSVPRNPGAGTPSHLPFPVVGIGASAGGLRALTTLLDHLPADGGMAYVVILHLSPKHESNADKVLQRSTRMPVRQVTEPTLIEPNTVYVISPNNHLSMSDGYLRVEAAQRPFGAHVAIDLFFRALADVHREHAIGIVLSGTGSDGSVGLARVREQGGVTIAQALDDAEYGDMPRNAIGAGIVDFVLPVADIPDKLLALRRTSQAMQLPRSDAPDAPDQSRTGRVTEEGEKALSDVLGILASRTGHDFRHYKRATVLRRVERRMQVKTLSALPDYRDLLSGDESETDALLGDMLISVTNFFRDREAFEALEREVVPTLFEGRAAAEVVRAWVAGCATGEEAYSLAMLLCEHAGTLAQSPGVQVFASDIDQRALSIARAGNYPGSIITDVPPSRLRAFFENDGDRYRVRKSIRDRVLFAQHNLLRDPPFSQLDLVCCRNLLIYLNRDIQARVLETFHFALRPGGFLFLGSSESAEVAGEYFEPIDKKNRIFRTRMHLRSQRQVPSMPLRPLSPLDLPTPPSLPDRHGFSFADVHQRALAEYASPSVLVDADSNILHLSDGVGQYLRFGAGEPSRNLLDTVHPELRLEVRTALFQARSSGKSVEARKVRVERDGQPRLVNMVARPFRDADSGGDFVLVMFDSVEDSLGGMSTDAGDGDSVSALLEQELRDTRQRLQSTMEQSDAAAEELRASNEELQAINEELRSTTEELETSKEELQSLNEELITVNYELKNKVDELSRANDDLHNFIASTDIATVFVDPALHIKRYTPRAASIFNTIPADVGRYLLDITHRLHYPQLADDAAAAFETLQPIEREVRSLDGRWYLARILPYRTGENRIDGAVLTFVDFTSLHEAEDRAGASREQSLRVLTQDDAPLLLDADGHVLAWSPAAVALFGQLEAEARGMPAELIELPADRQRGTEAEERRRADAEGFAESARWYQRQDGSRVWCRSVTVPLSGPGPARYLRVLREAATDDAGVQPQRKRDRQLEVARSERASAQAASALKDEFLAVMSHELKQPLNLIGVNAQVLARLPELRSSEHAARALDNIQRSVRGQAKIIEDLLDLSRMRTGKLDLSLAPVDLVALVRGCVEVAQADTSTAHMELEFDTDHEPVLVYADAVRVEQVVWNLLGNAIKFTPPGGKVALQVRVDGPDARLEVSDTGQGIAAEFLPHIFEMFDQGDGHSARNRGGLGVGLALVRQLAELHGGHVAARSAGVGQGATLLVWLPLYSRAPEPEHIAVHTPGRALEGVVVLIVDDNRETLDSLGVLLGLEGACVLAADSAAAALEVAAAAPRVDLLLSDIGMPGMDGYQLVEALHAQPRFATLPAIALTGFGRGEGGGRAAAAGFSDQLTKPVSMERLVQAMHKVLAGTDAGA